MKTATAQAAADSKETQEGLSFIKYFLLGFGGIALFVGAFVIANTLAITVAQRMRELATLRTLGASRRQVLVSVIVESLAIGLLGSIIGLFLGLGIALGLTAILESTGVTLPSGSLVMSPRTVLVSIGTGTLIACWRASGRRVAQRASSRSRPCARAPSCRYRASPATRSATSAIVGAVSLALFTYGAFADGVEIKPRIAALISGVLLMFVARRDDRGAGRPAAGLHPGRAGGTLRRRIRQARPPERRAQPGAGRPRRLPRS